MYVVYMFFFVCVCVAEICIENSVPQKNSSEATSRGGMYIWTLGR